MWVAETSKLLFCCLCILWTSKLLCLDWPFDKINHPISHYLIVCPLIKPVIYCYLDLICLGKGAEIDCIDCKGLSPLLMASNCGAWKTVAYLLSIGKTFSWIFNTFSFSSIICMHISAWLTFSSIEKRCRFQNQRQSRSKLSPLCHSSTKRAEKSSWDSLAGVKIFLNVKSSLSNAEHFHFEKKPEESKWPCVMDYYIMRCFEHAYVLYIVITTHCLLQCNAVKEMLSDEDVEGCTPLHYACKLGIHDSVKNMLGLNIFLGQKSREKKSALHFAAEWERL